MALTPRQQQFVTEYLVDLNASAAYRRSGYCARNDNVAAVEGHRLLRNPKIAAAVQAAQQARSERVQVQADDVVRGLRREAEYHGAGTSHAARVTAWAWLGKHLGMFLERQQVQVSDEDVDRMIEEELARLAALRQGEATDVPAPSGDVAPASNGAGPVVD